MQRFSRALDVPGGDRIGVRLAIAEIFLRKGQLDEAHRQIALGFAEARRDTDSPVTAEDILAGRRHLPGDARLRSCRNLFEKAKMAGANNRNVEIGLTNTYLAQGETRKAEAALASLGPVSDFRDDYDYMMASANVYRQRQDPLHALSAFAQASTVAGQEDHGIAESAQYERPPTEGRQIIER